MQSSWVNPLGVYDSSTAQWLQGKGQEEQTEQQRQSSHTEQRAAHMTRKTEEFNRQLRERPADTELWIKFIKYQVEKLFFSYDLCYLFIKFHLPCNHSCKHVPYDISLPPRCSILK